MKIKPVKILLSLFLSLSLLWGTAIPVLSAEEEKTLVIASEDRFLQFAENCRLDSYSKDLTVTLQKDLDLTGREFSGIPLFLGTFHGNHHKIEGLHITADGSSMGLFRFLGEGSLIKDLTVSGTIAPEGSALNIGGIAGSNSGTIEDCRFEGTVQGVDRIGGIAGSNQLTGIIDNCRTSGSITGDHFLGGAAGENRGVIRDCINRCAVNTTPRENTVNVKSISIETITGTESPNTVTDIGGIAGTSVGVIRDCINRGDIGYLHMGYNIGGIAGSQVGYIDNCVNYGKIYGRKEVGGIVGQFEPISEIQYQIDTLQILEEQLSTASSLLNRASYNAQGNMGAVGSTISGMMESSQDARDAIEQLRPENEPDKDSFIAAHNAVKNSIYSMHTAMEDISDATSNLVGQLGQDMRAVSSQLRAMSRTIKDANEHMGITLTDVSDEDTEDNFSGKVSNSRNHGPISGDLNAGGIAGSIAYENDLDPEDDLVFSGERSMKLEGSLRAVILNCENRGTVTAKKLHAGGIVGWMSMGLIQDSVNTGVLDAEKVQYVGGIAGSSRGYIRNCHVKCELSGSTCIGGIAGSGTVATDCLSMVTILKGSEKMGAVLGIQETPQVEDLEDPVKNNFYMNLSEDPGAIDGISYQGLAQPMSPQKFQQLPDLPKAFQQVTLIFEGEHGGAQKRLELPIGSVLHPEDIPVVPEKENYDGSWEDLDTYIRKRVYFDKIFVPVYTPHRMTIASTLQRENGRPVLLAEGLFSQMKEIPLEPIPLPEKPPKNILEAWKIPQFSPNLDTELHYSMPEAADSQHLRVYVCRKDGKWEEAESAINGRHLVFTVKAGDQAFCLEALPDYGNVLSLSVAVLAAVLVSVLWITVKKKKRRGETQQTQEQEKS